MGVCGFRIAGMVRYKTGLLSFLDVLAFSGLVESSTRDESDVDKIIHILSTLKAQMSSGGRVIVDENNIPKSVFHFLSFSDLVVRLTFFAGSPSISDYLNWELVNLANKQCQLVCEGILLRGGVTFGDIHYENELIFGPALLNAYKLESEVAMYPRIVIHEDLVLKARNSVTKLHEFELRSGVWPEYITRGEDGVYFVDYLVGAYFDRYVVPRQGSAEKILKAHKDVVLSRVNEIDKRDTRKKAKVWWLLNYHNAAIGKIRTLLPPDEKTSQMLDDMLVAY
jgi:hypothetical protein